MSNDKQNIKRVNYFDGQRITESDLDNDQNYFRSLISNLVLDFHSSGILQIDQNKRFLLDLSQIGKYGENLSKSVVETGRYDGRYINLDRQPSDIIYGNRLIFDLKNSDSRGRNSTKVLIVGRVFNSINDADDIVTEVLTIKNNDSVITRNYYNKVFGIILNNYSGGLGKNHFEASIESLNNLKSDTALTVYEAQPLTVHTDLINFKQDQSPNFDLMNFISSSTSNTIKDEISAALSSDVSISQVYADFEEKEIISFEKNANINIKYGQKFLSKNNNIQNVQVYMSVDKDTTLADNYDWNGDLIFSLYELSTELSSCSKRVPESLLDYDPELSPIIQISMDKQDLEDEGIKLTEDPQLVTIDLSNTIVANPSGGLIEKNKYYAFEIKRSGLNNVGKLNLFKGYQINKRKEELNIPLNPVEKFGPQHYTFYQFDPLTNQYVDDKDSSMWMKVHSSSLEVTDGICYTTSGLFVMVPKTYQYVGDNEVLYYERNIDLPKINGDKNYLVLENVQSFKDADVHPRTGNFIYTRIQDIPGFKFLTADELASIDPKDYPLILASIADKNPRSSVSIEDSFDSAGLYDTNYFYILSPSQSLQKEKFIGRNFIPDTDCQCKTVYEIIDVECKDILYGDLNKDGEITSADVESILELSGNTINSEDTERRLFGSEFDIIDFEISDLNDDGSVDGFDIELLEDAIEGKNNFLTPRVFRYLKIYFQDLIDDSVYPTIFQDSSGTGTTTVNTDSIQFTVSKASEALAIRIGDKITILTGSDAGEYEIYSKSIASDAVTVTVNVTLSSGVVLFQGTAGNNVKVVSQTKTNLFTDNFDLIKTPYSAKNYLIYQNRGTFNKWNFDICDLRRFVEVSYVQLPDLSCLCDDTGCELVECDIKSQNEKFLPGNLLVAGNILDEYGKTHKLDYEYASVTIPLPPGSLTDCKVDIYNNFVKSLDSSCLTAAGLPAMKYSDGTYVGCEDNGENTDMAKNRVKIDGCIASLYVDAFVDGYASNTDRTTLSSAPKEILGEQFADTSYTEFSSWIKSATNPSPSFGSITNPSGLNQPATFIFNTANVSGEKRFVLEKPSALSTISSDFIIDFVVLRTSWDSVDLGPGTFSFSFDGVVENRDSFGALVSTSEFSVGIRKVGSKTREAFFSGEIVDSSGALISSFDFGETLNDVIGDDITFRIRRIGDVVTAYYHISKKIIKELNKFERIGENLTTHIGAGTLDYSLSAGQANGPTTSASYALKVSDFIARSSFLSFVEDDDLTLKRDSSTGIINRVMFNFPLNLSQKTNIIRADITFTSLTSGTITDPYFIIPLEVLDLRTAESAYNYPETTNESLFTEFIPGTITAGTEFTVDISSIIISYLKNTAHLSGFYKALIIEPSAGANSEFHISSDITLSVLYEDVTSGVIFQIGMHIDGKTGIASLKTKNILYDKIIKENRTVLKFGVHLKKAGFANKNVEVTLDQLQNIGIGTCYTIEQLPADNQCYFVTGNTSNGTFVEGPFPCVLKLNE